MSRKRPRGGVGDERCPRCGKRFRTLQGVADHIRDMHSGRQRINGKLAKLSPIRIPADDRVRGIRADCLPPEILSQVIYGELPLPSRETMDAIAALFSRGDNGP